MTENDKCGEGSGSGRDEIIVFRYYRNELDAVMAKSVLDSEGIPAIIIKDDAGGMVPGMQFISGVRLMIRASDWERAVEILGEEDAQE